jgi:hypothetical protein
MTVCSISALCLGNRDSSEDLGAYIVEGVWVSGWLILEEIARHCAEFERRWLG